MALHNLKITVVDGGRSEVGALGGTSEGGGEGEGKKEKSLLYKVLNYNQTIRGAVKQHTSATTFFAIQQGVSLAKQVGREFINYYVSDIGRANGDSNYQAIVNRKIEVVTDAAGFLTSGLSGAAMGSAVAGPIGAAVGAAVGAVVGVISQGVSLGFKYAERERAYQHEMFQQNTSQAYQLARANYSALTGRVR